MNLSKIYVLITGVIILLFMSIYFTSCVDDKDEEFANCDGTTCDSSNPYSNQYTSSCYSSKSDCENATGHTCVICD